MAAEQLFGRIELKTLSNEVVNQLRDAIVSGKLRPGERLVETDVAEQMSVSRSPVREAFRQIEHEGLIVSIPNQGSFVRQFDAHDIREIFSLRSALETLAMETIVESGGLQEGDVVFLKSCIDQQQACVEAGDFFELAKADMAFHEYIVQLAGSRRLLDVWRSLRGQMMVLFNERFWATTGSPQTVGRHHAMILEALKSGDTDRIRRINREINARVAEESIEILGSANEEGKIERRAV